MTDPAYCPYCLGKTIRRERNAAINWLECSACGAAFTVHLLCTGRRLTVAERCQEPKDEVA